VKTEDRSRKQKINPAMAEKARIFVFFNEIE
jgi:hypothetical protein